MQRKKLNFGGECQNCPKTGSKKPKKQKKNKKTKIWVFFWSEAGGGRAEAGGGGRRRAEAGGGGRRRAEARGKNAQNAPKLTNLHFWGFCAFFCVKSCLPMFLSPFSPRWLQNESYYIFWGCFWAINSPKARKWGENAQKWPQNAKMD